ncbi:MAG: hypothetical protein J6113_09710, partial [Lachnospiraceae bacterium]|nr:hypothetical protein [Lachnospiraceae bacterium]
CVKSCGFYRYYFAGRYVTGWQTIKGNEYYFDSCGFALTGTYLIGNEVYTFDNTGVLTAGGVELSKYTGYVVIGGIEVYVRNGRIVPFYRFFGNLIFIDFRF